MTCFLEKKSIVDKPQMSIYECYTNQMMTNDAYRVKHTSADTLATNMPFTFIIESGCIITADMRQGAMGAKAIFLTYY